MSTANPAPLPTVQKETALRLVNGTIDQLAAHRDRSHITTRGHLSRLRHRLAAPRSSRAVLAHVLLSLGHVPPPTPPDCAPEFTDAERLLMVALAQHSQDDVIAKACDLTPDTLRRRITALRAKAGAGDRAHLVALGHAWKILTPAPALAAEPTSAGDAR